MTAEEIKIMSLAESVEGHSDVGEIVGIFASVMRMVCDLGRESGTEHRNHHPAAKAVAKRLRELVFSLDSDCSAYEAYRRLSHRAGARGSRFGDLYDKYEGAMDACNLSGIVFSFDGDMERVRDAAASADEPLQKNPIVVCMVDKIIQLTACY